MNYYHVSTVEIAPGEYLSPWYFYENNADILYEIEHVIIPKGPIAVWLAMAMGRFSKKSMFESALIEHSLEDVRREFFPTKRSRKDAIFLWENIQLAHLFISKYKPNGIIHLCELENGTAEQFDMKLLNTGMNLIGYPSTQLNNLYERSKTYWTGNNDMQWPETLAWGNVRVISKL